MSGIGSHCRPCEKPRKSRRRRGTVWLCSCGQAWVLRRDRYITDNWFWETLSLQAVDNVARHQLDGIHDVLEALVADEGVET